jgi:hypothetical protein
LQWDEWNAAEREHDLGMPSLATRAVDVPNPIGADLRKWFDTVRSQLAKPHCGLMHMRSNLGSMREEPSMSGRQSKGWFAAKRYGYGSSLPITWQGWLVLAAFVAGVLLVGLELSGASRIIGILVCVAAFGIICFLKTEGGWRWRWNEPQ